MEGGTSAVAAGTAVGTGSKDDVDERTIFVRSLPYTVNDAQVCQLLTLLCKLPRFRTILLLRFDSTLCCRGSHC